MDLWRKYFGPRVGFGDFKLWLQENVATDRSVGALDIRIKISDIHSTEIELVYIGQQPMVPTEFMSNIRSVNHSEHRAVQYVDQSTIGGGYFKTPTHAVINKKITYIWVN